MEREYPAGDGPKPPPSGLQALRDLRPRLVRFLRQPGSPAQDAMARSEARQIAPDEIRLYVEAACHEWLRACDERGWRPLGSWSIRNGQVGDMSAFPDDLPPEYRLATLSISATLTSTKGLENESILVVFEAPGD